jgi:hypothetical protein
MPRCRTPLAAILAWAALTPAASAVAFTMAACSAKVAGVTDGDTLTVLRDRYG